MKNWAGNLTYKASRLAQPESLEELQSLVRSESKVKVLGTRHSFSDAADTDGVLVSLTHFNQMEEPDPESRTVRVGGGVTYGELAVFLHHKGWALHNLASLPHISAVGAAATATHGSGVRNGNLATAVAGYRFVLPSGEILEISLTGNSKEFEEQVVHLGALGPIAEVILKVEPTFQVSQTVYTSLSFEAAWQELDRVSKLGYSVSLFTTWINPEFNQIWVKRREDEPGTLPVEVGGAKISPVKLHPLPGVDPVNCTEQEGQLGPWHERLPHFKMEYTPSAGEELQSEFFVPREKGVEALQALAKISDALAKSVFVTEVRFVASDSLLMSPACGQDVTGIHFTWRPDWELVQPALAQVEKALKPFGAKPHFGKLHTLSPDRVAEVYPGLSRFREIVGERDPDGKFANSFLSRLFSF